MTKNLELPELPQVNDQGLRIDLANKRTSLLRRKAEATEELRNVEGQLRQNDADIAAWYRANDDLVPR